MWKEEGGGGEGEEEDLVEMTMGSRWGGGEGREREDQIISRHSRPPSTADFSTFLLGENGGDGWN